jgi:ATP-dependent helicase HrpA
MRVFSSDPALAAPLRKIRTLLPKAMLRDRAAVIRKLKILFEESAAEASGRKRGLSGDGRRGGPLAPRDSTSSARLLDELSSLQNTLEGSARETGLRRRHRPALQFPAALPITSKRAEIVRAIQKNPVVIISGETGCGKSTQIPKMCLEAGRGIFGKIACTQPRRIAAVTIAHRIAEEMRETVGRSVGYKIRFEDRTPREAYIKIMTDGMLLAETQSDRELHEYDTLIIDEAHERTLNIDFLLGIARSLLKVRPELKVIITSATLDTEKFSAAFPAAPILHAGGRMYPVDVEYFPEDSASRNIEEDDYIDLAVRAVEGLKAGRRRGDILIFMPTERDILETCERLEGKKYAAMTTILPLYARLPASQQGRVYAVKGPKIVVATNVAETSLTIPGIRYVVDTGLARIAQYQPGTRINSLPVSAISRASADQRKGRCGRVQEGLCIRLYTLEDYESRPAFTPPEILRANLAEVILRMLFLGLGHPSDFPFVDRPHPRAIRDGYETLLELGAVVREGHGFELTPLGRRMALFPLDPRISRMLIEARKENCLREVAIIASALSIRDPRERPPDQEALADQAQARFAHPDSDFLTLLNIWDGYHGLPENPATPNERRQFCREHFLSYTRVREWTFVHDQILSLLKERRMTPGRLQRAGMSASLYAGIHRAILSGFLSNIAAHKEKNIYHSARGGEVMVFPGSSLFNKSRPWIAAAEMVRTTRLFARTAAKIDPAWIEALAGDMCRYSYSSPYWDRDRGEVRAKEKVTLFGLEIVTGRDIAYGPKNPDEAQKVFVQDGLMRGLSGEHSPFIRHNLALQKKIEALEEKMRRRNIMVSDEAIADFYSRRLSGIYDCRGLQNRIRQRGADDFLEMKEADLLLLRPDKSELALYPDELAVGGRLFPLSYKFSPGEEDDGVTLKISADEVKDFPALALDWGVPGYFKEKIAALIKGLPKRHRRQLAPVSETVDLIVRGIPQTDVSLFEALAKFVRQRFGADIPAAEWARSDVPRHLKTRVAVIDGQGRTLAAARDLAELRQAASRSSGGEHSPEWKAAQVKWEREGIGSWDFGSLPESIAVGPFLTVYPALQPGDKGVNIRLFKDHEEAISSHTKGVEALLLPRFAKDLEYMRQYLAVPEEYERTALFLGGRSAIEKGLLDNLRRAVFRRNLRTGEEFESYAATAVRALFENGHSLRQTALAILDAFEQARRSLRSIESSGPISRTAATMGQEIREDLESLVPKNFLDLHPLERLRHFPRYLSALAIRAERGKNDPEKDRKKAEQVGPFAEAWERMKHGIETGTSYEKREAVREFRWQIEEFKVSLFAPELKTAFPVSAKRLAAKAKEITQME